MGLGVGLRLGLWGLDVSCLLPLCTGLAAEWQGSADHSIRGLGAQVGTLQGVAPCCMLMQQIRHLKE